MPVKPLTTIPSCSAGEPESFELSQAGRTEAPSTPPDSSGAVWEALRLQDCLTVQRKRCTHKGVGVLPNSAGATTGAPGSLELGPRFTLLTEAERMAGWIGVNNVDAARLLHRVGEDNCTKFGSPETSRAEVRNGQVEMKLLGRTIWPFWRGIRGCTLEGQLERRITGVHLTPLRITDVQLPIQKVCVKGRKS